jgi:uncharacterized protein
MITREEIEQITKAEGEYWAYPHVQRVLHTADQIRGDLQVHSDWFWYAVLLHDWGAFPKFRVAGIEHALRSRQVAEQIIMPHLEISPEGQWAILEAIEKHDYRDKRPVKTAEALLLREADFLDFLGPLGAARELAWGPNNLPLVIARIRDRIHGIRGRFTLPAARSIAERRIQQMEAFLDAIEVDSGGYL